MNENEVINYNLLIRSADTKYDLRKVSNRLVFAIRPEQVSKIGLLILGETWDYVATNRPDNFLGCGFEFHKRLCDATSEDIKKIIERARKGIYFGDAKVEKVAMRDVALDVKSLRALETRLYAAGFELPKDQAELDIF